jgi:hypothetical protein
MIRVAINPWKLITDQTNLVHHAVIILGPEMMPFAAH